MLMFFSYMFSCGYHCQNCFGKYSLWDKRPFSLSTELFALCLTTPTNTRKLLIAKHRNTQQKGGVWEPHGHAVGIFFTWLKTLVYCSQVPWEQWKFHLNINTARLCSLKSNRRERLATTQGQTSVFFNSSKSVNSYPSIEFGTLYLSIYFSANIYVKYYAFVSFTYFIYRNFHKFIIIYPTPVASSCRVCPPHNNVQCSSELIIYSMTFRSLPPIYIWILKHMMLGQDLWQCLVWTWFVVSYGAIS